MKQVFLLAITEIPLYLRGGRNIFERVVRAGFFGRTVRLQGDDIIHCPPCRDISVF
jgi:hypothetical protein